MTTDTAAKKSSYRSALRHRDFRFVIGSLVISAIGSWAYNVALVVFVYDATHSPSWVAAASLARFIPALLFSTYSGVIAERFERVRVLLSSDALATVFMLSMATAAAMHGPVVLVIALAMLTTLSGSVYPPAVAALTPQIVGEEDLAAANALNGAIDNLVILVGPALGGLLLLAGPPSVVMYVNAGTFVVSFLLVRQIGARSSPSDVASEGNIWKQMAVGFRAVSSSSSAALLVGFSVLASFFYGTDTVLFAVVSNDKLGTGSDGYGYLLAALGVGGILGAALINRFASSARLGPIITAAMILYCAPTALLVVVHQPALAFGLQVIRGFGTFFVDTLAITALQRSLPGDLIARVFGVFFALVLGAISLGALLTPVLLRLTGLDTTLLLYGLVTPALVLLSYPKLAALDRLARTKLAELAPRIAALEGLGILTGATRNALERLAGAATELPVAAGTAVVTEGEPADAFYVVAEGRMDVSAIGEGAGPAHIRYLGQGDYFGEIGLLEHIPRTATVRAASDGLLYRIDGDEFLSALQEAAPSASLVQGVTGRLARTHPSYRPHITEEEADGLASTERTPASQ